MERRDILGIIAAILICELAGIAGSLFTGPAVSSAWYAELAKPFLQPPNWIFAPVWTVLFALMGVAAFLAWKRRPDARAALGIFAVQLALNILWSALFFGLRSPGGALIGIFFLWLAILATVVSFSRISRLAAWLLAPYLLWVAFAAYLNYAIWTLNQPGA